MKYLYLLIIILSFVGCSSNDPSKSFNLLGRDGLKCALIEQEPTCIDGFEWVVFSQEKPRKYKLHWLNEHTFIKTEVHNNKTTFNDTIVLMSSSESKLVMKRQSEIKEYELIVGKFEHDVIKTRAQNIRSLNGFIRRFPGDLLNKSKIDFKKLGFTPKHFDQLFGSDSIEKWVFQLSSYEYELNDDSFSLVKSSNPLKPNSDDYISAEIFKDDYMAIKAGMLHGTDTLHELQFTVRNQSGHAIMKSQYEVTMKSLFSNQCPSLYEQTHSEYKKIVTQPQWVTLCKGLAERTKGHTFEIWQSNYALKDFIYTKHTFGMIDSEGYETGAVFSLSYMGSHIDSLEIVGVTISPGHRVLYGL